MQTLPDHDRVTTQKRRPRRAALFAVLAAAVALAAAVILAPAWQATEQREASLPQLEVSARSHPEDGALSALLAARLMQAGETGGAAGALKQAAGSGEQGEEIWLALASANAAAGKPGRAVADLILGVRAHPDSPLLPERLADARALGPYPEPGAMAKAISPQGPEALLAVYGRGSFLNGLVSWWGRRHPETSGFATREAWAGAAPDDAEAQRLWGEALAKNRRLPEAVPVLRRAAALAPRSPACRLALADALRRQKLLREAAQEYIAALKLRPDWAPALMGLGDTFQANGLSGYAINSYRRATQVAPLSADAWVGLGTVNNQNGGGIGESVAAFEKAARLAPDRTDYFDDYAGALRRAGRWGEAEAVLRRRLRAAPEDAYGHFVLATILMDSKPTPAREADAEANLREALRLSPGNPVAEVSLSEILLDQGLAAEALPMLLDSRQRLPFERRTILLLSRAYRLTGQDALAARNAKKAADFQRDEDAASVLESAKRAHLTDVAFHERLAAAYDRIGKPEQAAQERQAAQALHRAPGEVVHSQQDMEAAVSAVLGGH